MAWSMEGLCFLVVVARVERFVVVICCNDTALGSGVWIPPEQVAG